MHLGILSQTPVCQQSTAAAKESIRHSRLRLQGPSCRSSRVSGFALKHGKAHNCWQQKLLEKHGFPKIRSLRQPSLRLVAAAPSSGVPEPLPSAQQSIPEHAATNPSKQRWYGRWIADTATLIEKHVIPDMKDLIGIPAKLHYLTVSEIGWTSAIVCVTTVVLTIVVRTLDSTLAAAIFWSLPSVLWLSSVCSTCRILAAIYCITMFGTMYNCVESGQSK